MKQRRVLMIFLGVLIVLFLGIIAAFSIPSIRERILWKADEYKVRLDYALNPPEEAVFIPVSTPPGKLESNSYSYHFANQYPSNPTIRNSNYSHTYFRANCVAGFDKTGRDKVSGPTWPVELLRTCQSGYAAFLLGLGW